MRRPCGSRKRGSLQTFLLSVGLSLWAQDGPYEIPYEKLSERHQKKVRKVMDDITVTVPMDRVEVATRTEIYDFLLEELPLTSEVCRELGRSKYEVFRDPEVPKKEEEKDAWRHTYYMDDKEGLNVKVELVLADRCRRIYYTWGSYDLSPLPKVYGRSVIVVVWKEKDGKLVTESKVFAQVHSAGYKALSGLVKGLIEDTVREKSTVFVKAARWVSETAAKEPRRLYNQVKDAKEVDQNVLEEFRKRFLEK